MKVIIAADRPVIGETLALALSSGFEHVVTRVCTSSQACRSLVEEWHPQLAVVDLDRPVTESQRLFARLHEAGVATIFMVENAADALDRLEEGAAGVVSSDEGLSGVVRAAQTVVDGHTYVPAAMLGEVLRGLIEHQRRRDSSRHRVDRLSDREREVFLLLGDGQDQTEIGRSLAISPHTAKTHIRHVLTKLGVRSRVEAAAIAAEFGLTPEGSPR